MECEFSTNKVLWNITDDITQDAGTMAAAWLEQVKSFPPPVAALMASDIYLPAFPPIPPYSFFLVFLACKYLSSLSKPCIFDGKEYLKLHLCWNISRPMTSKKRDSTLFFSFYIRHWNDYGNVERVEVTVATEIKAIYSCLFEFESSMLSFKWKKPQWW